MHPRRSVLRLHPRRSVLRLHPRRSAQDVLLCDLCKTDPLQSHCERCRINFCVNCVGKHLSDSSKKHNVVPYLQRNTTPQKVKKGRLHVMNDSLSSVSISTEQGCTMKSPKAVSPPTFNPLIDESRLTATINTEYRPFSVSCLSEEQVWICGYSETMTLLNLHGKLPVSIQTEPGCIPQDITVTQGGDLIYVDRERRILNLVKNSLIRSVITLQGWRPWNICSTSSDDILVTMDTDDLKETKVARYSGFKETQTIQFDEQGGLLYSFGNIKYISENRNLDICVADCGASSVVVVNQSGKLRFRYSGHPSNTEQSFTPVGITTDSQSHILTADCYNDRIHILDQDGQFLCYIQNCDLERPFGLCVDTKDNLFVANRDKDHEVKQIRYALSQRSVYV